MSNFTETGEKLSTSKEMTKRGFGSTAKLARDRQQGKGIPFIYIGRAVRYRESDVKKWLDSNTRTHALQVAPEAGVRHE